MTSIIYVNGHFLDEREACVSVLDRGFMYGDGLFETLRVYRGKVFRIGDHLTRLYKSAAHIFLDITESQAKLEAILYEVLKRNGLKDALVRVQVTRGPGPVGLSLPDPPFPTLVVHARPLPPVPERSHREGVNICLFHSSAARISEVMHQVKSTNYLSHILVKKLAADRGCQEGIFLDDQGHLCEGTTSNLFMVKDGMLKTPELNEYVLAGVTRQVILEVASGCQIPFRERALTARDLYAADEVFLTSTGIEVLPVCQVDDVLIGAGGPGEITRTLHQQLLKMIEAEHGSC
ncbi:MAG: aminotransferase class IV [Nitrospinaceae bacterium]